MIAKPTVVVVAGVILNPCRNQILLSLRPPHLDQGGLWEYPGGKVEQGESVVRALERELKEELAIEPLRASELCTVMHDYGKKIVELHFFVVEAFRGEPTSMESQSFDWWAVEQLPEVDFPEANRGVSEKLNAWLHNHPKSSQC